MGEIPHDNGVAVVGVSNGGREASADNNRHGVGLGFRSACCHWA